MYICNNCCYIFESPAPCTLIHDEVPPPNAEHYHGCPICGAPDYSTVYVCCVCGEEMTDHEGFLTFQNGDIVCNMCLRDYCKERYV